MSFIFSKGSGVTDSAFGKSQEPICAIIEAKQEWFEKNSALPLLFKTKNSKHFAEKIASMTAMDDFLPVGEGGATPMIGMQEGFSKVIEPETWKGKFTMTQEMVEDGTLMSSGKPEAFSTSFYRSKEKFGLQLYANAVSGKDMTLNGRTFNTLSNDKVCQFATNHPSVVDKKKTQSNRFKLAFSVDNLSKVQTAMQNFQDDKGNYLSVAPNTIVIPNYAPIKRDVFAAIGADKDPNTANNGFNYQFGMWNVIINQELNSLITSTNCPWILMDSNYNDNYFGAVWLDRVPLTVRSDIDPNTDDNIWKGRARFTAAFNDWRFAAVSGVTDGSEL